MPPAAYIWINLQFVLFLHCRDDDDDDNDDYDNNYDDVGDSDGAKGCKHLNQPSILPFRTVSCWEKEEYVVAIIIIRYEMVLAQQFKVG